MTKPKILNGNSLNPLSRLEKRLAMYKNHHNESQANCNKKQETHNKLNLELKLSLERKSKISDSKVKKKRTANGTSINRKKTKIVPENSQSKQFFEDCIEATPNISLNIHTSEFPDIDLDTFDILKDPNFSMSINEQELDGVLKNCCSQSTNSNDLFANQLPSERSYSYKSSVQAKPEPIISNMNSISFKSEVTAPTPLFPPPEISTNSRLSSSLHTDYTSSLSYMAPNNASINYASNIVPPTTNNVVVKSENMKYNSNMYSSNMTLNNGLINQTPSSYTYQYGGSLNEMPQELPMNNGQQYFYQYVNFPSATNYSDFPPTNNSGNSLQLPTMSSGWYNNPPTQAIKQSNCKLQLPPQPQPQQQQTQQQPQHLHHHHQFLTISPTTGTNYHNGGYPQYQVDSMATTNHQPLQQCKQIFNNHYDATFPTSNHHQSYNLLTNSNPSNYNMIHDQNSYYYVNYSNVPATNRTGVTDNSVTMINQGGESQFINSHNNANICRNVYQPHCI